MNKAAFFLFLLALSCNRQPKVVESRVPVIENEQVVEQPQAEEKPQANVGKPQKKVVEEDVPEVGFIHEGGDIQEFDEEGNPI